MRIIFAGTPDFSVPVLEALLTAGHDVCAVYTQPDRPKGRGRKLTVSPVKACALTHDLPVLQPLSLRTEQAQAELKALKPDLMVVVAYGLILPQAVLDIPSFGCINVHASLLPKYRGASPIQAAILNGDQQSGITIMQMDKGLDTGDMILKQSCNIESDETTAILHDKLAKMGADAIIEAVALIRCGDAKFEKQDDNKASYAGKISKKDAIINWQQSAVEVYQTIRAYNPWPVAFTYLNGEVIRIWCAELESNQQHSYQTGQLVTVAKDRLIIACATGLLAITQLQLAGGRPMSVQDCLNAKKALFNEGDLLK